MHCQWPVLLPFDVDDPRLLPLCIGCVGLGADVLQVELSVPGPHPASAVGGGGGVPVLLLGSVAFPAGLSVPGGTLITEPKIVNAAVPCEIA
jgi:hypothetical protein